MPTDAVAETVLRSHAGHDVVVGDANPFVIIGERINPTGRKKLAEELKQGNYETVRSDALAQVAAGARVLDLNAGIPGFDEAAMLSEMVRIVNDTVDVPICIDSSTPEALEAAVPLAGGKVLINSVTAEQHSMDRLLPLVAAHGAAVIGMANDESGISMDPDERFAAAAKVVQNAERARHQARGRDHRPARDADRRGARRRHRDGPHDRAHPLGARREPVLRRLQHLLRDARPPRDRRRVPHGDVSRTG